MEPGEIICTLSAACCVGLKQDLAYDAGKDVDLTMALVMLVVLQDITLQTEKQKRGRRYAYEDTHEWPKDNSLEYDFDEKGETDELTLGQKIALNWQKVALKCCFLFAAAIMFLAICCCCCKIWCRMWCQSLKDDCFPCWGAIEILTSCYQDPMYNKAKKLADLFGLKLDYATYMKIKDRFELEGTGPYNPLGLPWMN